MKSHGKVTAEQLRALARVREGIDRALELHAPLRAEDEVAFEDGPQPDDGHDDDFDSWCDQHEQAQ